MSNLYQDTAEPVAAAPALEGTLRAAIRAGPGGTPAAPAAFVTVAEPAARNPPPPRRCR